MSRTEQMQELKPGAIHKQDIKIFRYDFLSVIAMSKYFIRIEELPKFLHHKPNSV